MFNPKPIPAAGKMQYATVTNCILPAATLESIECKRNATQTGFALEGIFVFVFFLLEFVWTPHLEQKLFKHLQHTVNCLFQVSMAAGCVGSGSCLRFLVRWLLGILF